MEKTRIEWFKEAKENGADWVDAAIYNTVNGRGESRLFIKKKTLSTALSGGFFWRYSPEGHKYWKAIYDKIKQEEVEKNV